MNSGHLGRNAPIFVGPLPHLNLHQLRKRRTIGAIRTGRHGRLSRPW